MGLAPSVACPHRSVASKGWTPARSDAGLCSAVDLIDAELERLTRHASIILDNAVKCRVSIHSGPFSVEDKRSIWKPISTTIARLGAFVTSHDDLQVDIPPFDPDAHTAAKTSGAAPSKAASEAIRAAVEAVRSKAAGGSAALEAEYGAALVQREAETRAALENVAACERRLEAVSQELAAREPLHAADVEKIMSAEHAASQGADSCLEQIHQLAAVVAAEAAAAAEQEQAESSSAPGEHQEAAALVSRAETLLASIRTYALDAGGGAPDAEALEAIQRLESMFSSHQQEWQRAQAELDLLRSRVEPSEGSAARSPECGQRKYLALAEGRDVEKKSQCSTSQDADSVLERLKLKAARDTMAHRVLVEQLQMQLVAERARTEEASCEHAELTQTMESNAEHHASAMSSLERRLLATESARKHAARDRDLQQQADAARLAETRVLVNQLQVRLEALKATQRADVSDLCSLGGQVDGDETLPRRLANIDCFVADSRSKREVMEDTAAELQDELMLLTEDRDRCQEELHSFHAEHTLHMEEFHARLDALWKQKANTDCKVSEELATAALRGEQFEELTRDLSENLESAQSRRDLVGKQRDALKLEVIAEAAQRVAMEDTLRQRTELLEEENSRIQVSCQDMQASIEAQASVVAELKEHVETLEAAAAEKEVRSRLDAAALQGAQTEALELERMISEMESSCDRSCSLLERVEGPLSSVGGSFDTLLSSADPMIATKIFDIIQEHKAKKAKLLRTIREDGSASPHSSSRTVSDEELQRQVAEIDAVVSDTAEIVVAATDHAQALETELQELEGQRAILDEHHEHEARRLRGELSEIMDESVRTREQSCILEQRLAYLRAEHAEQVADISEHIESAVKEESSVEADQVQIRAEMAEQRAEHEERVSDMSRWLAVVEDSMSDASDVRRALQVKLAGLHGKHDQQVSDLQRELTLAQEQKWRVDADRRALEKELQGLKSSVRSAEADMAMQLNTVDAQLEAAEQEKLHLAKTAETLKQRIVGMEVRHASDFVTLQQKLSLTDSLTEAQDHVAMLHEALFADAGPDDACPLGSTAPARVQLALALLHVAELQHKVFQLTGVNPLPPELRSATDLGSLEAQSLMPAVVAPI